MMAYSGHRRNPSLVALMFACILVFCSNVGHGHQISLPELSSPSYSDLLEAAGANADDPQSLMTALLRLSSHAPSAADAELNGLNEPEKRFFLYECQRRGAITEEGMAFWKDEAIVAAIKAELEDNRLHDPRRQIDAITRRLEEIGTVSQLPRLFLLAKQTRTQQGAWRFYATIQGILTRETPAVVVDTPDIPVNLLAPLLRDLPPSKSGTLGIAFWERHAIPKEGHAWWQPPALATRLWLAWAISDLDPSKAFDIFSAALECNDPGLRVFAGMGILRITDAEEIPFSLLALPHETEAARRQWLTQRTVHKPNLFQFPSPQVLPIIKMQRGSRVDLNWVREDASVSRMVSDVWPTVQWVLPDGTFCVINSSLGCRVLSLATQQGDISVTFPGAGTWSYVWPTQLGGFMGSAPPYTAIPEPAVAQSGEFSPMGELVWACNTRAVHVSAGSRGTALLVQYGLVEVVNRRGDVLWKVSDKLDNPRWACMIDEDTVLIACKKDIQVHHRNTGLLSRVAGFESVSWVRYHPQKPWMVFDGGSQSIVFYNSETKERNIVRVGWTNDDPAYWSKWMPKSQRVPE